MLMTCPPTSSQSRDPFNRAIDARATPGGLLKSRDPKPLVATLRVGINPADALRPSSRLRPASGSANLPRRRAGLTLTPPDVHLIPQLPFVTFATLCSVLPFSLCPSEPPLSLRFLTRPLAQFGRFSTHSFPCLRLTPARGYKVRKTDMSGDDTIDRALMHPCLRSSRFSRMIRDRSERFSRHVRISV
jgi:hypothetical protein